MANLSAAFDSSDRATPGYYGASETALLLLDFHALFVEKMGGAAASAALSTAIAMRTWAESYNILVVHALIDIEEPPYPTCKDSSRLGSVVAAMKEHGSAEPRELVDGRKTGEKTFLRTPGYVSALKSPRFEEFLREAGIKSLVLCGLSTSGCVMRTAVQATDAEYVVTVLSDGCADPGEGVHDMLVGKILPSRAFVMTAADFRQRYVMAVDSMTLQTGK